MSLRFRYYLHNNMVQKKNIYLRILWKKRCFSILNSTAKYIVKTCTVYYYTCILYHTLASDNNKIYWSLVYTIAPAHAEDIMKRMVPKISYSIVSTQVLYLLTWFVWTPGIDCLVMKYMSMYVYGVCYLKTDTTHSYNFRLPNSFFL